MTSDPLPARIEPIRKSITVAAPPARAFVVFTQRMDAWWPFDGKSVFGTRARTVTFEPRAGGTVFEESIDGERAPWGRILAWNPPASFRMVWHPGRDASTAQELEVRFVVVPEGTRVELEHSGWEKLLDEGRAQRDRHDHGWSVVLAAFTDAVAGGVA
jgi:uncharacterized protein YndB with AHSA1/START domain